jgi:hypothetical protein
MRSLFLYTSGEGERARPLQSGDCYLLPLLLSCCDFMSTKEVLLVIAVVSLLVHTSPRGLSPQICRDAQC